MVYQHQTLSVPFLGAVLQQQNVQLYHQKVKYGAFLATDLNPLTLQLHIATGKWGPRRAQPVNCHRCFPIKLHKTSILALQWGTPADGIQIHRSFDDLNRVRIPKSGSQTWNRSYLQTLGAWTVRQALTGVSVLTIEFLPHSSIH